MSYHIFYLILLKMAKKITIYVPDELSVYTWKEIVQLAKKWLSSESTIDRDNYLSTLEKIYQEVMKISNSFILPIWWCWSWAVNNSTVRWVKAIANSTAISIIERRKSELSEKQMHYYSIAINRYKDCFSDNGSRWTEDKIVDSCMVFSDKSDIDEILHIELCLWLRDKDIDWTVYVPEKYYYIME